MQLRSIHWAPPSTSHNHFFWIFCSYHIYQTEVSKSESSPFWRFSIVALSSAAPSSVFYLKSARRCTSISFPANLESDPVAPLLFFSWKAEDFVICYHVECPAAIPCGTVPSSGSIFLRSVLLLWASAQSKVPCHLCQFYHQKSTYWVQWPCRWSCGTWDRLCFISWALSFSLIPACLKLNIKNINLANLICLITSIIVSS